MKDDVAGMDQRVPYSTRRWLRAPRPAGGGEYEDVGGTGALPQPPTSQAEPGMADPDRLEELGDRIAILTAHISAATHQLLVLIAEFDRLRGWEAGGHRSCAHWLAFRTQIDLGTAREKVRAARALEALPQTAAAMARGELTFSQVRALTRVAAPETEADLLELARGSTTAQLERMIRAYRRGTRQDEAERERELFASRTLSVFPDDDGMYVVQGRLMPEVGALLMRAIEAASDALFREHAGAGEDTVRESARRRADALALLAERALAAGFGNVGSADVRAGDVGSAGVAAEPDAAGGLPVPVSGTRAERYQVVLHVDDEALRNASTAGARGCRQDSDVSRQRPTKGEVSPEKPARETQGVSREMSRELCEHVSRERPLDEALDVSCETSGEPEADVSHETRHLDDGSRVSHESVRRLCCDASIVRVTRDGRGAILSVGRRTRTISPALRRALEVRDRGCRFPGCGLRFTDAHHVVHWADGGETSLANCLLLCAHHHRLVHEGGWTIMWWGRETPVFLDPRGHEHVDVRRLAEPRKTPSTADLVETQPGEGIRPGAESLGARWRSERDVPAAVWRRVSESL